MPAGSSIPDTPNEPDAAKAGASPLPPIERIARKALIRTVFSLLFIAACLFIPAGTLAWPMAWAYLVVSAVYIVATVLLLWRYDPGLLWERIHRHKDAKGWDMVLVILIAVALPLTTLVIAGLDRRFGWSTPIPIALQIAALVAMLPAFAVLMWSMLSNSFFSAVIRIQHERGHRVVDAGPYAIVRHPGYAVAIWAYLMMPVALGTLWGFVPIGVAIVLLIVRTSLEDQTLADELEGYRDYAARVRYRLARGVW